MAANRKVFRQGQGADPTPATTPTATKQDAVAPVICPSLFYSPRGRQLAGRLDYAVQVAVNAAELSRKLQSPTIAQLIETLPAITSTLGRARREYDVVAKRTQSPMSYPEPQSAPDAIRATPLCTLVEEILLWDSRMQLELTHYADTEAPLLLRRASYTYCTTVTKALNRLTSTAQSTRSKLNSERRHIIPFPAKG